MDETTIVQLVALTVALVEGLKIVFESFLSRELNPGAKVVLSVVTGAVLASVAEFAPEAWVRVVPILTVGLVAAGLYSLGKRGGTAVVNGLNGK